METYSIQTRLLVFSEFKILFTVNEHATKSSRIRKKLFYINFLKQKKSFYSASHDNENLEKN